MSNDVPTSARTAGFAILTLLGSLLAGCNAPAAKPELTVAISTDIPPYIMKEATTGIEVDILKDGRLDLPDAVLADLDCVVASVHSHFGLSRVEQTARDRVGQLVHERDAVVGLHRLENTL